MPAGILLWPSYWNIMYNALLNLQFSSRTKVIAFADDLIVLTRGASTKEAENYSKQDLKKLRNGPLIIKWNLMTKNRRYY